MLHFNIKMKQTFIQRGTINKINHLLHRKFMSIFNKK